MLDSRFEAITDIIRNNSVSSQSELLERLEGLGFETTQSSVSRDLKKLGVVKVQGEYRLPNIIPGDSALLDQLDAQTAGDNMIVLKTTPGNGNRAAFIIDTARIPEVIGTIAGDDTIFVAVKNRNEQIRAIKKIYSLFQRRQ